MIRRMGQLLVAWVLGLPCASAASGIRTDADMFVRYVMSSEGIPGLQALVIKGGHVVWAKSYGNAVLDQPGPRRLMRNDSLLFTASTAKILVTVAALRQVEKGQLGLRSYRSTVGPQFHRALNDDMLVEVLQQIALRLSYGLH